MVDIESNVWGKVILGNLPNLPAKVALICHGILRTVVFNISCHLRQYPYSREISSSFGWLASSGLVASSILSCLTGVAMVLVGIT